MRVIKCNCSRCLLYRPTHSYLEEYDYDIYEEDGVTRRKLGSFEAREYQTSLIEIAKRRNIIACLPTGSGKTYIALKLIESLKGTIENDNKKVIFLANTIPLVAQQAAFFARHLPLKVKHITGDMEVDYWSGEKWAAIIQDFHILAMTTQIFLNIITHAYMKMSQVALLIFDECHHAIKDHPMKHIMDKYQDIKKQDPNYIVPKILGMTATIIKGNCTPFQVPSRIEELEKTMQAKAVTYKDYEDVLKHSTSSKIILVAYSPPEHELELYGDISMLIHQLKQYSKELNVLRKERKKFKALHSIKGVDPSLTSADNLFISDRKATPGDLRLAVDDVIYACSNLGIYCGVIAVNLKLAFIDFSLLDVLDNKISSWYQIIRNIFINLRDKMLNIMENATEEEKVVTFITNKLKTMISTIKTHFGNISATECLKEKEEAELCGIIFVDRRVTAQVLAWYLIDLAEKNESYRFMRANFVVGTSKASFESVETRIYAKKQTDTINGFRAKKYNLLVATSVLEEGIDVPSCNIILRFDRILTYTSYVQSMGRARQKGALFYALLNSSDYAKESSNISNFQDINKEMVAHLIRNVEKIDEVIELAETEHNILPFCPGGTPDSPSISMESAIDIVEMYCMTLPNDGLSNLQSIAWWNDEVGGYQGSVKLPINSVVPGTIKGQIMKSKDLAKQSAYLETTKRLYEADVLDENLLPTHPVLSDAINAFFKGATSKRDPANDDNEPVDVPKLQEKEAEKTFFIRKTWFKKKSANALCGPVLTVGVEYKVYRISIELADPNSNYTWQNLYKFPKGGIRFGIVCSENIPHVGEFPMYGGFGTLTGTLKTENNNSISFESAGQLNYCIRFQEFMFSSLLDLGNKSHYLTKLFDVPYLIVPLSFDDSTKSWSLNTELMEDTMKSFNGMFKMKRPHPDRRKMSGRFPKNFREDFTDRVIFPWYKKGKPIYVVDSVETDKTPLSPFHDGLHANYKNFIKTNYNTDIYDVRQPLLKCKLAGVGKGRNQLNYLLETPLKEDQFPVYLVPELCFKLPFPAHFVSQLKLIPSFLHRLNRLLLAHQLLSQISTNHGWAGALSSLTHSPQDEESGDDVVRLTAEQSEKKEEDERRRAEFKRRLETGEIKPLSQLSNIENRELHYEFIHPNKISSTHIKLFHEAVSDQYAAKQMTVEATNQLSSSSQIQLTPMEEIVLKPIEKKLDFDKDGGPSLLSIMEALTGSKSNEGVSTNRLSQIGLSFLNFAISSLLHSKFPHWSEPLLCQFRNRVLSLSFLSSVAQKREIGELISASYFYPHDAWLPPGVGLWGELGDVAAENGTHLSVFDKLSQVELKVKSKKELELFAIETSPSLQMRTEIVSEAKDKKFKPSAKSNSRLIPYVTYTHAHISDIEISEVLTALIGAFFRKGGSGAALKLIDWLGFLLPSTDGSDVNLSSLFNFPPREMSSGEEMELIDRVLGSSAQIEETIKYKFNDRKLLLEALTHPTYFANNATDCYQRLEFLGDSILDLLLSNHVFSLTNKRVSEEEGEDGELNSSPKYTIDELSEIRASLVNIITYASLSVRYNLNKHFLFMSKGLCDMIDNFIVHQEANEHQVVGHFKLISDEECYGLKHVQVPKVLGDILEALAGAIYIDSGRNLDVTWKVFYRLFENEINEFSAVIPKSPLRELKEVFKDSISFTRFTSKKNMIRGREKMKITVSEHGHYYGVGTNKTRARDAAAKLALKMISEETEFIKKRDSSTTVVMFI